MTSRLTSDCDDLAVLLRAFFAGVRDALVDWLARGEAFRGVVPVSNG
jgi:hypothetical protein